MRLGSGNPVSPAPAPRSEPIELDAILDAFEEAWQGGSAPSLRQFVPGGLAAPQRRDALFDLVKIDLDNRWRRAARGRAAAPVPVPPQASTRPLPARTKTTPPGASGSSHRTSPGRYTSA